MAQLGSQSEVEKPKFASLRKGQSIESISLNEVIDLFKLPREVGQFEDKVVTVAVGRFGPYVRHDGKFVSLGEYDPMSIELDTCVELILLSVNRMQRNIFILLMMMSQLFKFCREGGVRILR